MCSCFYLRIFKQLIKGLGVRLADELSDMIVKIKRASSSSHLNPPELPGSYFL